MSAQSVLDSVFPASWHPVEEFAAWVAAIFFITYSLVLLARSLK